MRKFLLLAVGVAALTSFAPASYAQGIGIDTPVGGVRIGEPGYRHHYYRDYDRPYVRERHFYRDRDVRLGGCKTVTIQRDDGSMKRIRRCD
jgi:hypothetical protein